MADGWVEADVTDCVADGWVEADVTDCVAMVGLKLMEVLKLMDGLELMVGLELRVEHLCWNLLVTLLQSLKHPKFLEDSMAQYTKNSLKVNLYQNLKQLLDGFSPATDCMRDQYTSHIPPQIIR